MPWFHHHTRSKRLYDGSQAKRIGYVYVPMGYYAPEWKPTGETLDSLPSTLAPLQPVKDDLCVLSGLDLQNAYPGSHATSNSAFLSAAKAKLTESSDYYLGTTVDQIAAQHIGSSTPLPSLELAMDLIAMVGQCDNGYACVYQNNLSWSSPTTPLPSEAHPRLVLKCFLAKVERLNNVEPAYSGGRACLTRFPMN